MINVIDSPATMFGDRDDQKQLLQQLTDNDLRLYISQYIEALKQDRDDFANTNVQEATDKIIKNYSTDELIDFIINIREYIHFLSYRQSTDRLFVALGDIVEKNGKLSVKNAFKPYVDNNELNDGISASFAQTYKGLVMYYFMLIRQMFMKLGDNNALRNDKAFLAVIDEIKNAAGNVNNLSTDHIVDIIRNGMAHFSYKDNSMVKECSNVEGLAKNLFLKIWNKKRDAYMEVNIEPIMKLANIMINYLNKKHLMADLPQDYYSVSKESQRQIVLEKYKILKQYGGLKPYQIDFLNFFINGNTEYALTMEGYVFIKSLLQNPEKINLRKMGEAFCVLGKLNYGRNKSANSAYDITSIFPILTVSATFNALSYLSELKLTKDFVRDNKSNPIFAKIPIFKMETNPKNSSVVNKFRLLRNCLTHAYMLDYGYKFYAYDVDEDKKMIDLGEIEYNDLLVLCELIENYICKHYESKFEDFKAPVKSSDDVM